MTQILQRKSEVGNGKSEIETENRKLEVVSDPEV